MSAPEARPGRDAVGQAATGRRSASRPPSGTARPVIDLHDVEAVYPDGDGVGPLTLSLAPGERLLVVGPSGSGKSTVLRLLHGAVPQVTDARVTGSLDVVGLDPLTAPVHDFAGRVGVVLQNPADAVCLGRVDEDVALPLECVGAPVGEIDAGIDRALALAGAGHLRDRATSDLSGGELQRVDLASGLAGDPVLLLLDEPTSMLDADGVASVREAVDAAAQRLGAATVMVEHRLDELTGDAGPAALPPRWLVLDDTGHPVSDAPLAAMTWGSVRGLLEQGCWLPADLELHALLGDHDDAEPVGEELAPALDVPGIRGRLAGLGDGAAPAEAVGAAQTEPEHEPEREPVLVARGLDVAAGGRGRRVLTGVDLDAAPGELVAIIGANGSGKSSLLTTLAGLADPLAGTVTAPRAAMVFQDPEAQMARRTVRAEAAWGLPDDDGPRVDAALEATGLARLAERSPFRLSGGQKRILSLVSVLLHRRRLLCADEPTFGLDRRASRTVLAMLRETSDDGACVLVSTHDMRAVAAWADRVLVVGGGTILADGDPGAILRDGAFMERAGLRPSRLVREADARVLRELDAMVDGARDGAAV
ncbi:ABC transporter ATP-binding protein [Actinomyces radicidentis]|uniref:ABC transporter ATP-binding protein n=1 Tax=Actinomyces radicidentis TaxID=111015 RepID=UPI0028E9BFF1|nr:ABC transporter ATP-binding protein [Actinomyces radicidentis]